MKAYVIVVLILFAVQAFMRVLAIVDERAEWPRTKKTTLAQECVSLVLDGLFWAGGRPGPVVRGIRPA